MLAPLQVALILTLNTLELSEHRLLIRNIRVKRLLSLLTLDIWILYMFSLVVLEHTGGELVILKQEDLDLVSLGIGLIYLLPLDIGILYLPPLTKRIMYLLT